MFFLCMRDLFQPVGPNGRGKFKLEPNQEVVKERKVVLKRVRVKEYPEKRAEVFNETGMFHDGDPVNVLAELEIYDNANGKGEPKKALWPVNLKGKNGPVVGMWFACRTDWESDEDEFMRRLRDEMERLSYVTAEKKGFGV